MDFKNLKINIIQKMTSSPMERKSITLKTEDKISHDKMKEILEEIDLVDRILYDKTRWSMIRTRSSGDNEVEISYTPEKQEMSIKCSKTTNVDDALEIFRKLDDIIGLKEQD